MKEIAMVITTILALSSCSNKPGNMDQKLTLENQNQIESIKLLPYEKGMELLQIHCYSCHNPNSNSHDNMLAPPLAGIKYKYSQLYKDRTEFIYKMSEFIERPSKENALMKGPVRRFGLMPKTTIATKEEINQLIGFIHANSLEYPEWFPEHFEQQHGKPWNNK